MNKLDFDGSHAPINRDRSELPPPPPPVVLVSHSRGEREKTRGRALPGTDILDYARDDGSRVVLQQSSILNLPGIIASDPRPSLRDSEDSRIWHDRPRRTLRLLLLVKYVLDPWIGERCTRDSMYVGDFPPSLPLTPPGRFPLEKFIPCPCLPRVRKRRRHRYRHRHLDGVYMVVCMCVCTYVCVCVFMCVWM